MAAITHLGIIPDGNRRWAKANALDYHRAYRRTAHHLTDLIQWCFQREIENLSIYMLSRENLERKREDLDAVIRAEIYFLSELIHPVCMSYGARVIHAGDREILPPDMRDAIETLGLQTSRNTARTLYLLLGYHPMAEIHQAQARHPGKALALEDLSVPANVDLIIRTAGGTCMTSNFLPLQCGYAQHFLVDAYFNDMTRSQVEEILTRASATKMLYGR